METTYPLIILNPTANRGKIDQYRTLIRSRLAHEEADYVETNSS